MSQRKNFGAITQAAKERGGNNVFVPQAIERIGNISISLPSNRVFIKISHRELVPLVVAQAASGHL